MNYQTANSALGETSSIMLLRDDGAILAIPLDRANRDYQEYLAWLAAGNTPEPAPEPPAPVELTIEQKLASVGLTIDDLKSALGL